MRKKSIIHLTFINICYVGVAEVTPYVYNDLFFFFFFVKFFQHHKEFVFQSLHASEAKGRILFNKK